MRTVPAIGVFLASLTATAAPALAQLSVGISVDVGPPVLPVYAQPPIPAPGYLWTPGYWAWDPDVASYYWVPGAWVLPPAPGLLWTPAWWGWSGGSYAFHSGYWGPQVGFYGGIAYGFGYSGSGYQGAYWRGNDVYYNRTVNNVTNVNVTNVYERTVVNQNSNNRVSYNGGPGGVAARPTPTQQAYDARSHVPPTAGQQRHVAAARADPQSAFRANRGRPPEPASRAPVGGAPPPRGPAPADDARGGPPHVTRPQRDDDRAPPQARDDAMRPSASPRFDDGGSATPPRDAFRPDTAVRIDDRAESPPRAEVDRAAPPRAPSAPRAPVRVQPPRPAMPRAASRPSRPPPPRPSRPEHR